MTKEDILKMRNIEVDRLKNEKPMLFHNILRAMDDYAEQVKNLTIQRVGGTLPPQYPEEDYCNPL